MLFLTTKILVSQKFLTHMHQITFHSLSVANTLWSDGSLIMSATLVYVSVTKNQERTKFHREINGINSRSLQPISKDFWYQYRYKRGHVLRGWLWNFVSHFYSFCPNDLKTWYCGRFGCFFKVPKFQGSTPIFCLSILRNQPPICTIFSGM